MDIERGVQILTNLALYGFGGYVFISFVIFVIREIAPKVMSGKMVIKEYISLLAGGLVVLFLLAFGPYYLGKALAHGWELFQPIIVTLSSDIVNDLRTISTGNDVIITLPDDPELIPTPIMPQETPVQVLPTPTLAPTATVFDFNVWTPDQAAPTPSP